MNKKEAYKMGVDSGYEAGSDGDFTASETADEDSFVGACMEICENKRQYAGHPGEDFNAEPNADGLWDAFDEGEITGARKAWVDFFLRRFRRR